MFAFALFTTACRINWVNGDGDCDVGCSDNGGGGEGGYGAEAGSGGQGAQGGEGGAGGSGGSAADGGAGGEGGVGGEGGAGGAAQCIGVEGAGVSAGACDEMNVAYITECPNTDAEPFAVSACHKGFELYEPGAREALLACLSDMPADLEVACYDGMETAAIACIDDVYANLCPNQVNSDFCASASSICAEWNDPNFAEESCSYDLMPFSHDGLVAYSDCFNNAPAEIACADLHDHCMNEVGSI